MCGAEDKQTRRREDEKEREETGDGAAEGDQEVQAARELSAVTAGLFMSARAALFYWFAGA